MPDFDTCPIAALTCDLYPVYNQEGFYHDIAALENNIDNAITKVKNGDTFAHYGLGLLDIDYKALNELDFHNMHLCNYYENFMPEINDMTEQQI
ncbi:MAG: hypothetical protein AAF153_02840, partial [Pseudomonadota bacterium]